MTMPRLPPFEGAQTHRFAPVSRIRASYIVITHRAYGGHTMIVTHLAKIRFVPSKVPVSGCKGIKDPPSFMTFPDARVHRQFPDTRSEANVTAKPPAVIGHRSYLPVAAHGVGHFYVRIRCGVKEVVPVDGGPRRHAAHADAIVLRYNDPRYVGTVVPMYG